MIQGRLFRPFPGKFGAEVSLDISTFLQKDGREKTVNVLMEGLHRHRFLLFRGQNITWRNQIRFGELFGALYEESSHVNRKKFAGEKDPRVAIFSNDPKHGLKSVGIEGYHVDGNVAPVPHKATMIYCEKAVKHGDTLLAPLREVAAKLAGLGDVAFRSMHMSDVVHPLMYPHPATGDATMVFGLGSLSGLYKKRGRDMSRPETDAIVAQIDVAIQAVDPYRHEWAEGDMLILDNLAMAHYASPGTQDTSHGLRIMRRITLAGTNRPSQRISLASPSSPFPDRRCDRASGSCLVSLKDYVNYTTAPGVFDTRDDARRLCRYALSPRADLARLDTPAKVAMATSIVGVTGEPHWLNAYEIDRAVAWLGEPTTATEGDEHEWIEPGKERRKLGDYPWHTDSGQPNDCDGPGSEPCLFVGPGGKWFDFACGPKEASIKPDGSVVTPGPEITWTDGTRRMHSVFPLCELSLSPAEIDALEGAGRSKTSEL